MPMHASTVLHKTYVGQRVLKDRSVPLAQRQRTAFILFDGKRTLGEVLRAAAGMGVVEQDVETLVDAGLLEPNAEAVAEAAPVAAAAPDVDLTEPDPAAPAAVADVVPAVPAPPAGRSPQERYREASAIATELTAGMGLRGFKLNLSVEAAMDLDGLRALVPKIRAAVGADKCVRLEQALNG